MVLYLYMQMGYINRQCFVLIFFRIYHFVHGIDRKFDVICLIESWLTSEDNINEYIIEGHEGVNVNRTDKRGDGVIIFVSKSINQCMSAAIDGLYV